MTWTAVVGRAIDVQDVAPAGFHGGLEPTGRLTMRQSKVQDEAFAQECDFRGADTDVSAGQVPENLLCIHVSEKEGLAHMNHDVVCDNGLRRYQAAQFFGSKGATAPGTSQDRFPGPERTDMKRSHGAAFGLQDIQAYPASGTNICLRLKIDCRWLGE